MHGFSPHRALWGGSLKMTNSFLKQDSQSVHLVNLISYLIGFRQGDKIPEAFIASVPPVGNVEHTCLASCKGQWLLPGLRVDIGFRLTVTIIFLSSIELRTWVNKKPFVCSKPSRQELNQDRSDRQF